MHFQTTVVGGNHRTNYIQTQGGDASNNGYRSGSYGTLSPLDLKGNIITAISTSISAGELLIQMTNELDQDFWTEWVQTSGLPGGAPVLSADATSFVSAGGTTLWRFAGWGFFPGGGQTIEHYFRWSA